MSATDPATYIEREGAGSRTWEDLTVPVDDELLPTNGYVPKRHPADLQAAVQIAVGELDPLHAQFLPRDLVDDPRIFNGASGQFLRRAGSWPVPGDAEKKASRSRRWVNPQYHHRHVETPVRAVCDCGAVLKRWQPVGSTSWRQRGRHTTACRTGWKMQASGRLIEAKRKCIVNRVKWTGEKIDTFGDLLVTEKYENPRSYSKWFNDNIQDLRREYYTRRDHTLLCIVHDRDIETAMAAYGITRSTVGGAIRRLGYSRQEARDGAFIDALTE